MKAGQIEQLRLAEQAAAWLTRLEEDAGAECRREFVAWLKHSPRHLEELLLTAAVYEGLGGLDPQRHIDVRKLVAQSGAKIVSLQGMEELGPALPPVTVPEPASAQPRTSISSRSRTKRHPEGLRFGGLSRGMWSGWRRSGRAAGIAAAAVLVLAGAAGWIGWLHRNGDQIYSTVVGEQRSVRLVDGSIVYLNTHSRVAVHFSQGARDVRLLDGEALFVVAHDTTRPFRVRTGAALIQAVGTQFNVYQHNDATTVSVIEGRVRVTPQEPVPQSVGVPVQLLAAGEEVQISRRDVVKHPVADLSHAVAWRQRQFVFRGDTLANVVEQVNRYSQTHIKIAAPAVAARRLSGVFSVDDLDSLLQFLNGDGDLSFERKGDDLIIHENSVTADEGR